MSDPKPRTRKFTGKVLDIGTAATEYFGGSRRVVENLVARKMLPVKNLGGRKVFLESDLHDFFQQLPGVSVENALANCEARTK